MLKALKFIKNRTFQTLIKHIINGGLKTILDTSGIKQYSIIAGSILILRK